MAASDQAQAQAQSAVHTSSVAATTALNKLAKALQDAGVDADTVKAIDEMSNQVNSVASAAVGNAPAEPAPPEAAPPTDILDATTQMAHGMNPAGYPPGA